MEGRASFLLNASSSENQTYLETKELLLKALTTPIIQKFNVIKKLTKLMLEYNSKPFEYISDLKFIIGSFEKLKKEV